MSPQIAHCSIIFPLKYGSISIRLIILWFYIYLVISLLDFTFWEAGWCSRCFCIWLSNNEHRFIICVLDCMPGKPVVWESVYISQESSWTSFFSHDKDIRYPREVVHNIFLKWQNIVLTKNLPSKRQSTESHY